MAGDWRVDSQDSLNIPVGDGRSLFRSNYRAPAGPIAYNLTVPYIPKVQLVSYKPPPSDVRMVPRIPYPQPPVCPSIRFGRLDSRGCLVSRLLSQEVQAVWQHTTSSALHMPYTSSTTRSLNSCALEVSKSTCKKRFHPLEPSCFLRGVSHEDL